MSQVQENAASEGLARKALEALVVDNPDLERLEALLDQFNIFEAIGAVRQEVRHSDFLAFLFNPQQNHGLGDIFLKRLLQKVLSSEGMTGVAISPIDLDIWSLDEVQVLREWQNIDILLLDEPHHLAVIIENKIDSSEHSNQLQRYRKNVDEHYPGWRVIGLFLTPDGEEPSDERYLSVDYGLICQLLEGVTQSRASTLGPDVLTAITHYTQMLRRHIVAESEIAELCRRIYQKHQRALDLIYEHRPDRQGVIREVLESLIQETTGLALDSASKGYIHFVVQEWDVPALLAGKGWTASGRMLLFEFNNAINSLKLRLYLGPGPQEIRHSLFSTVLDKQPPFRLSYSKLYNKWNMIYDRSFLTPKSYDDGNDDELIEEIRKQWAKFVENDLPLIADAVRGWIEQATGQ